MDDLRLAQLAARQGGIVTVAQLAACGLSRSGIRSRVKSGRLFRVGWGVYALGPVQDAWAMRWATVLSIPAAGAALSHWSAAEIHRMHDRPTTQQHVTVPGTTRAGGAGIVVHRTRTICPEDVVVVRGLPVTSPARTVLDIAARASDDTVRRMIREGEFQGLLPVGAVPAVVRAHPHHPGVTRLRRVDPQTAESALLQTPLEDELDLLLRSLPMPPADRQIRVVGASGAAYRLDFGWHPFALAAEADSRSAHERASALESDRFRDNDLAAKGWLTMRFVRRQIVERRDVSARQLMATALRRGWAP
ncbi:type IV toxin-antitoxin system AbiEi family antitoxin domain-containing protein [Patulibacter minatonensis]|uniref:type IV toxin-antitoxin system AbiEi family antitoxin domain-containing protein n=1 Tax=Patulibacter minatonensis TaxID=298163 RepID=UPI00047D2228|nr:type IV toxin-antitoxin system AbiEi family antitoxin domain-containing protein [Patulibacter minatonensis]